MSHEFHNVRLQDPINWGWPPNRGLIAAWLPVPGFCGGLRWFEPVGRNHGTLTNMVPATDWVPFSYGGLALDFAGGDDVVISGTDLFDPTAAFTVILWLNQSGETDTYDWFFEQCIDDITGNFALTMRNSGDDVWAFYESKGSDYWDTNITITKDVWTQLGFIKDASDNACLYKDGQQVANTAGFTISANPGKTVQIGSSANYGHDYNGLITGVRIYQRELSAAEMLAIYEDDLPGMCEQLNRHVPVYPAAAPSGHFRRLVNQIPVVSKLEGLAG